MPPDEEVVDIDFIAAGIGLCCGGLASVGDFSELIGRDMRNSPQRALDDEGYFGDAYICVR